MTQNVLTKLRHKQAVKLFEKKTGLIHHIQFNKNEQKFVCWERYVKYPGTSAARLWNSYLSLKDIDNIIKNINKNK